MTTGCLCPEQYGGDIQGMMDAAAAFATPVMIQFAAGVTYTISATIACDLPHGSWVDARGAKFICTHNGVAFDLNPVATALIPINSTLDTWTKMRVHWQGGDFKNTNATRTASVAFQCYFMRGAYFTGVYTERFYAGWKFGAKDTYHWTDCLTYLCTRSFWVPESGVLFPTNLVSNCLQEIEWRGCHLSTSQADAGIYMEDFCNGFRVYSTSFNGPSTTAHVRLSDGPVLYSRDISFHGAHFEQMANGKPAVLFAATNAKGFYNIAFDGGTGFSSGAQGWRGVTLARCRGVRFGACSFTDGSGGSTERGIFIDTNSADVTVGDEVQFLNFPPGADVVEEV